MAQGLSEYLAVVLQKFLVCFSAGIPSDVACGSPRCPGDRTAAGTGPDGSGHGWRNRSGRTGERISARPNGL